jgi:putative thioredoxin
MISANPSPENYSLLIKSLVGLKSFNEIEQIIKSLSPDIIKDRQVQVAISSYELLKDSNVENSKSEILDKIKKSPSDLDAKMSYSKILLQESNFSDCIDVLLEIFKEDREWKEGLAKKQLLSIFDYLGTDDALSKKGRRSLTSLIFA